MRSEVPLKPGLHNGTCKPSLEYCWLRPLSSSERDCKRYLIRGLQASKLREWQRRYDSSELLVLRMEDVITQDMVITSQRLARFIGVPDPRRLTRWRISGRRTNERALARSPGGEERHERSSVGLDHCGPQGLQRRGPTPASLDD